MIGNCASRNDGIQHFSCATSYLPTNVIHVTECVVVIKLRILVVFIFRFFSDAVIVTSHIVSTAHVFRSEEHTSELQSRSDLVCRLLLEKKKNKITDHSTTRTDNRYRRVIDAC